MSIDLSHPNIRKHIDLFQSLDKKPEFSISDDTDVHIMFFKRKDKYYGIRTAAKTGYESRAEFLVHSFMIEKINARVTEKLTLENLKAEDCSLDKLGSLFSRAKRIGKYLPRITDIESVKTIVNSSDLNWLFLEDSSQYHSLFWSETESKVFGRCA